MSGGTGVGYWNCDRCMNRDRYKDGTGTVTVTVISKQVYLLAFIGIPSQKQTKLLMAKPEKGVNSMGLKSTRSDYTYNCARIMRRGQAEL